MVTLNYQFCSMISSIKAFVLDLFFPRECLGCGCDDTYLCNDCLAKTARLPLQGCPICGTPNYWGLPCSIPCKKQSYIDQLLVAGDYHASKILPQAIHTFKYNFSVDLAGSLAIPLKNVFSFFHSSTQTVITSVPLHRKRLRFRGFNQSQLLAQRLAQSTGKQYLDLLSRVKNTHAQAHNSQQQRQCNMMDAFKFNHNYLNETAPLQHVTIVDDVYTTGSTLNECAKTLKLSGVKLVTGLVIARSYLQKSKLAKAGGF